MSSSGNSVRRGLARVSRGRPFSATAIPSTQARLALINRNKNKLEIERQILEAKTDAERIQIIESIRKAHPNDRDVQSIIQEILKKHNLLKTHASKKMDKKDAAEEVSFENPQLYYHRLVKKKIRDLPSDVLEFISSRATFWQLVIDDTFLDKDINDLISSSDQRIPTILCLACYENRENIAKILLEEGANPNPFFEGISFFNPLYAAIVNNLPHIVELLFNAGATFSKRFSITNDAVMSHSFSLLEFSMFKYLPTNKTTREVSSEGCNTIPIVRTVLRCSYQEIYHPTMTKKELDFSQEYFPHININCSALIMQYLRIDYPMLFIAFSPNAQQNIFYLTESTYKDWQLEKKQKPEQSQEQVVKTIIQIEVKTAIAPLVLRLDELASQLKTLTEQLQTVAAQNATLVAENVTLRAELTAFNRKTISVVNAPTPNASAANSNSNATL